MKVALCVSGILQTPKMFNKKTKQLLDLQKQFPYDTFVHTWNWVKPYFPDDYPADIKTSKMISLPSNDNNGFIHYNSKRWKEKGWDKWWDKYHDDKKPVGPKTWRYFNHWENLKYVDNSYDVIIRTDFDCLVSEFIWEELITRCYLDGTIFGINHASHDPRPEQELGESTYQYRDDLKEFLYDDLIIHPAKQMKNPYKELINGNLGRAETGWYKILGSPSNYKNIQTTCLELAKYQEFIKL